MGKDKATIKVVGDGPFTVGDTISFEVSPEDAGVISFRCHNPEDDTVLLGGGIIRGNFSWESGTSQAWDANPVPMLACVVDLIAGDRKRPIASDEFDLYRE